MTLPPDLVMAAVGVTSSGTANTLTTGTIVAAPGANIRIRLWFWDPTPNTTSQAVVNWRATANDGVGGAALVAHSGGIFAAPPGTVIPGGMRLTINTALGYSLASALISTGFTLIAGYTLESTA
jgi:hypothetical protein